MKKLFLLLLLSCSGCASTKFEHGKFYVDTKVLPVITNDKNYQADQVTSNKILIRGNSVRYIFNFKF